MRPSTMLPLPGLLVCKGTRGMIWTDGCGCSLQNERKTSTVDRLDCVCAHSAGCLRNCTRR